ncbi:MAG: nucleoside deaminase [Candidatus Saccharibacteria bacterium]|nr:nucleoside deaminase [Candidatus Saccharibacteria bacterium]
MYQPEFMKLAIEEAKTGIKNQDGGPFGAVIVKDNQLIAAGHNCVLKNHDSTCHGEIDAIRKAEQNLQTHDLSGCELYTTGEPCPMCLAAILWANIKKVYYGCTLEDNEKIGFRDLKFEKLMSSNRSQLPEDFLEQHDRDLCLELFNEYNHLDKTIY